MTKQVIYTKNAPEPIGPYNQAILVDNTLYISGQIPIDPASGNIVSENPIEQTKQVMENIKAVLSEAEMSLENIVKCSIFVKDLNSFLDVNTAYGSYFNPGTEPARECLEVSRLPKDVLVEISCIAVI